MSQAPKTIGTHTIDREIGRGGMGVVYLARDTQLDRPVAIKALPDDFAHDEERLARFQREARTLAQLNHPNIAGIYGIEEQDGRRFLILEYVDGETLADRLDHGPLDVDDALEISAQIAAGVEAAHEANIVHRDLKPGNVKITSDGKVKVLDFGLAKSVETMSGTTPIAEAPTVEPSRPARSPTTPGAVLGTAPYMSPEQARGRSVDSRTDIWSFGVVLYECLAGASPFVGETVTDSLGAILHADPDWSRIPPDTPPTVQLLVRRCLRRDRRQRLQSMGDARIELEAAMEDPTSGSMLLAGAALRTNRRRVVRLALAVVVPVLLVAGFAAGWLARPAPSRSGGLELAVPIPTRFDGVRSFDITPDGRTLAVVATEADESAIYLRDLDNPEFRELSGSRRATSVRFAPGGDRVFFRLPDQGRPAAEVRSIPVGGGAAITAFRRLQNDPLSATNFVPYTDDLLLVVTMDGRQLFRVPAAGGTAEPVAEFSDGAPVTQISVPRPGGRFAVVSRGNIDPSTNRFRTDLHRVHLETGETTLLLEDARSAVFLNTGRIVFRRPGNPDTAFVAAFDLDRAEVTGPAEPRRSGFGRLAASRDGRRLVYVPLAEGSGPKQTLVAVDASGVEPLLTTSRYYRDPHVSPDSGRIAFIAYERGEVPRVWVLDVASGLARPVSPKGQAAARPKWTPDGRIAYTISHGPRFEEIVVMEPVTGAQPEPLMPEADELGTQSDAEFSPDGRFMLLAYNGFDGREPGIYLLEIGKPDSLRPFFASPKIEGYPAFSPDGRWVAYHTDGSGRFEVYLRPFNPQRPESTPIHPVTTSGGSNPLWSRDGRTLYHLKSPRGDVLYAVTIETEPELKISEPRVAAEGVSYAIDVLPGGERFVTIEQPRDTDERPELRIAVDWLAGSQQ